MMQLDADEIYTVSQLNREVRSLLEETYSTLWVMGEISNLSCPSSGHLYFSLKDKDAAVRCALFRMNGSRLTFTPENGQKILVYAQVGLYEPRGDYQLIVRDMQPMGQGKLHIAFEQLKKKLEAEGLFSEEHKKEIPDVPKCVGVVTSSSGAAIQDILTVMRRRFPSIPVIIYPTQVQGDQAAAQIAAQIKKANARKECDVLIVARGGGSIEDLWPFNEEMVARAIFASKIPVVSGVGHEVDFTIADFVADYRAATPSAAAEHVTPDQQDLFNELRMIESGLIKVIRSTFLHFKQNLHHLQKRLRHPAQQLRDQSQRLDRIEKSLLLAMQIRLHNKRNQLETLVKTLDIVSPLKTLDRGYAIVTHPSSGKLITQTNQVKKGDAISTRLSDGEITSIVN